MPHFYTLQILYIFTNEGDGDGDDYDNDEDNNNDNNKDKNNEDKKDNNNDDNKEDDIIDKNNANKMNIYIYRFFFLCKIFMVFFRILLLSVLLSAHLERFMGLT